MCIYYIILLLIYYKVFKHLLNICKSFMIVHTPRPSIFLFFSLFLLTILWALDSRRRGRKTKHYILLCINVQKDRFVLCFEHPDLFFAQRYKRYLYLSISPTLYLTRYTYNGLCLISSERVALCQVASTYSKRS